MNPRSDASASAAARSRARVSVDFAYPPSARRVPASVFGVDAVTAGILNQYSVWVKISPMTDVDLTSIDNPVVVAVKELPVQRS